MKTQKILRKVNFRTLFIKLIVMVMISHVSELQGQVVEHEIPLDERARDYSAHYVVADSVVLRKDSTYASPFVAYLRVGERIYLFDKSDSTTTIKGMESRWYKCRSGNKDGWIWGGYIALRGFKSTANPDVLLLVGYDHQVNKEGQFWKETFLQVRAVHNFRELDRLVFKCFNDYNGYCAENLGSRGVTGLNDILSIHNLCYKCGCSVRTYMVFWNGGKFTAIKPVDYIGDAWASSGGIMIFPTDLNGETGSIKLREEVFDDQQQEGEVWKLDVYETKYRWDGLGLKRTHDRTKIKSIMIDTANL